MNEIKACGIVLCALVICVVFKNLKSEYSLLIRLIISISVFSVSLSIFYPVLSFIDGIAKNSTIHQYIPMLFKALGIAFVVQITADICKDAQENSLAERICLFGKAQILVISLPLIKNLFQLTEELLK